MSSKGFDGFLAIFGKIHHNTGVVKMMQRQLLIGRIILHQKDPDMGICTPLLVMSTLSILSIFMPRSMTGQLFSGTGQRVS